MPRRLIADESCSLNSLEGINSRIILEIRIGISTWLIWVVVKIYRPCLGTLNIRCRIIIGVQKGAVILTTTHMYRL